MIRIPLLLLFLSLFAWQCSPSAPSETASAPPPPPRQVFDSTRLKFQGEIDAFAAQDSLAIPPKGAVLFVGSSSIRMWKTLAEDMAPIPVINRGFGGSTMRELNHYINQLVLPYAPKVVVLYEGDNDITDEKTQPADVIEQMKWYQQWMDHYLPETETYFLGAKPSIARQHLLAKGQQTNALIRDFAATDPRLHYLDISSPLMRNDSTIMPDIFIEDNLHLNARGYAIWTETIKPIVATAFAAQ